MGEENMTGLENALLKSPDAKLVLDTYFECAEECADDQTERGIHTCAVGLFMDNLNDMSNMESEETLSEMVRTLLELLEERKA